MLIPRGTGPAGIFIEQYLSKYPDGTAVIYARNLSKSLEEITTNKALTVIKGKLTDDAALSSAFEGKLVDAV